MTVAAYWCLSENFGDKLTRWMVEHVRREPVVWVPPTFDGEHYVAAGSVLNHANEHAMVWGAGIASLTDGVNAHARIFAVRGPLSRARALSCGAKCAPVYGDPALVLPRLYDKPQPVSADIGYVPHYVDQYRVHDRYKGARIINLLDPIESVIDQIRSCRRIVSSALHGIVVAHAYGIEAAWVKWSDSIGGDGTKFLDHFMAVGLGMPSPVDRRESSDEIPSQAFTLPGKSDTSELWGMCPFRRTGE